MSRAWKQLVRTFAAHAAETVLALDPDGTPIADLHPGVVAALERATAPAGAAAGPPFANVCLPTNLDADWARAIGTPPAVAVLALHGLATQDSAGAPVVWADGALGWSGVIATFADAEADEFEARGARAEVHGDLVPVFAWWDAPDPDEVREHALGVARRARDAGLAFSFDNRSLSIVPPIALGKAETIRAHLRALALAGTAIGRAVYIGSSLTSHSAFTLFEDMRTMGRLDAALLVAVAHPFVDRALLKRADVVVDGDELAELLALLTDEGN